ncbi:Bax inhibitor-1/YccA family protein [Corynebacterium aquilae]|uniref:Membrane protein n=1 Tax=Corynebacterium aquilae DSM 44791 TaxID=1431546 RepID=A0A1L7CF06_9CORY|nr:Bax inhibitor-1/YccA family protein [Corynebacterium aquilae]APT84429.1 membrane protein [Corynebacterium aquilae DSM 44791]
MRSSNPVFSSLTKNSRGQAQAYTQAGYGQAESFNQYGAVPGQPLAPTSRAMTHDDVVTKTGITLGVIILGAIVTFFLGTQSPALANILMFVGMIGGLITVMVASFGRKYGSAAVTLIYAAFEGLFVGGISFFFSGQTSAIIGQAILGTLGVFLGMLFVYKNGIVKVTPRLTRIISSMIIGVVVLSLGNLVLFMFTGNNPLTNGGPIAILFSLVCIGLAAMSFLTDFDQADALVRAQAPANMAWGVALGLAVTLVWLYTEILRFLSYFQSR